MADLFLKSGKTCRSARNGMDSIAMGNSKKRRGKKLRLHHNVETDVVRQRKDLRTKPKVLCKTQLRAPKNAGKFPSPGNVQNRVG